MRCPWPRVLAAACLALTLIAPGASAHSLEIIPSDSPVYVDLYRLAAAGLAPLWAVSTRPLTRLEVSRIIARSLDRIGADRNAADQAGVNILERLVLEFSDELALLGYRVVEPPQGPSAMAITGWGVRLNRALVWRVESGAPPWFLPPQGSTLRFEIDGTFGLGPWLTMGATVRQPLLPEPAPPLVDRVYVSAGGPDILVQTGTMTHWWGPGSRGAFLISDNAGTIETLRVSAEWERLRLVKLAAPLSLPDQRTLYGMRVDWLAADGLRLGLSEVMVASGDVYSPYLLNPLPFLTYGLGLWVRQQQMGLADNYNVGFDFDWRVSRGITLYGEGYVDDLSTGGSALPTLGGATAGVFVGNLLGNGLTTLRVEHTRATNWIYATAGGMNNYVRNGRAVGHWCAPDCELWTAELARDLGAGAILRVGFDLVRKGEGQLGQTFTDPTDAWSNLYLSGVIETTQAWRLHYAWMPRPTGFQQEISVTWAEVANASHVTGQTRTDWSVWWAARREF